MTDQAPTQAVEAPGGEPAAPAPDANGAPATGPSSLQTMLRAAAARAQHRRTIDLEIPGYDGRLWGTFRALDDYSEVRLIAKRHEKIPDGATQELYVAADTLLAASVDTFAIMDGERHPLNLKLGRPLAAYLGHEGLENDRQALFEVFPSTMSVMAVFIDIDTFIKQSGRETEDELVGESEAAS